ncbi:type I-E CRISPR-associated protein Cse1/CasA [Streptomyces sp. NPDC015350]|uniref:type I-E CRISPR-associated protein Cse1/CasA n=1 Tax=Streptomyces sp. NPDC015350 TaxID=3364955 RepID=UPI0036FE6432
MLTEPWIPVGDTSTDTQSAVGITEALSHIEYIAVLRLLAAALDAAAGPSSASEWDAAHTAPALPTARITAYLEQWRDSFDLFGSEHPFGQCGHLTTANRTTHTLGPASWDGSNASHFAHQLRGEAPLLDPATAATALLVLQLWNPGGIQGAHPTDPAPAGARSSAASRGPSAWSPTSTSPTTTPPSRANSSSTFPVGRRRVGSIKTTFGKPGSNFLSTGMYTFNDGNWPGAEAGECHARRMQGSLAWG